ncbi:hypothetical protein C8R44DRAFT_882714 [Mycena epipterygia]|nr:hypothetical protein C8R44DRAFT_882714 [Mycena epipterygia]
MIFLGELTQGINAGAPRPFHFSSLLRTCAHFHRTPRLQYPLVKFTSVLISVRWKDIAGLRHINVVAERQTSPSASGRASGSSGASHSRELRPPLVSDVLLTSHVSIFDVLHIAANYAHASSTHTFNLLKCHRPRCSAGQRWPSEFSLERINSPPR